jgi:hypothetical protein
VVIVRDAREVLAPSPVRPDVGPAQLPPTRQRRLGWLPHRLAMLALVIGVVLTGVLAFAARQVDHHNEDRLVGVQVRQAAATLAAELASTQTPLQGAYAVAEATNADPAKFESFIAPSVGPGEAFVSVSLWQVTGTSAHMVVVVGQTPMLAQHPREADAFLSSVRPSPVLTVGQLIRGRRPRLGYAELPANGSGGWLVYAESLLPPTDELSIQRNSAFQNFNFEVFFGSTTTRATLLETSTPLSTPGPRAQAQVPFGDTHLTLVGIPTQPLEGTLSERLPWFVGGVGVILSLLGALMAERLIRRREVAEGLAVENALLYSQQRGIAETLQHALLPTDLPRMADFAVATRYVPGVGGMDIGGDWYDMIEIDADHCFLAVGDVSGRGLSAATTMAALRYAIRAYVAEGHAPETILVKLGELIHVAKNGHFATVLVGSIDLVERRVKLATAGHPPPLLLTEDGAEFLDLPIGVPVGVPSPKPRFSAEFEFPPRATLIAYTDGLIERRGEILDEGMERLRRASLGGSGTLDQLMGDILHALIPDGSDDDVALLGVQWTR